MPKPVSATAGTLNFPAVTGLTAVNLSASGGGQLLFPAATSYSGNGSTIQASGVGSTINLSNLATITNSDPFGPNQVTIGSGAVIDLAGAISGTNLTLSDAASNLNVAGEFDSRFNAVLQEAS